MTLQNTRARYGWIAIALHWISAIGVTALFLLGERMEDATGRAARMAAQDTHVSVGVLLFAFLAARLIWSATQPAPAPLERNRMLQILARAIQGLFLLMVAVLIITGPLSIWSAGRPIAVFDLFAIPSPFGQVGWLEEAAETVHVLSSKLFIPLILLHVAGALKHVVVDRDRTLQRMLWARGA